MLNKARRSLAQRVNKIPAELVAKTRISPNIVTALGLLVALVTAWVLYTGHFFLGGFLVLVSGAFDMLDGAVARISGRSTRFGAIFDSTFDRLSEAALFLGLLAYYANQGSFQEVVLVGAALVGSMMTSYVRARAEGLGLKCEVGLFTRPERVIVMAIGLLSGQLAIALGIIVAFRFFTVGQRLLYVWKQIKNE